MELKFDNSTADFPLEAKCDPIQDKMVYFTRHAHSKSNEMRQNWKNVKSCLWDMQLPEMADVVGSMKWLKPTRLNWMDTKLSVKGRQEIAAMKKHTRSFLKDHQIEVIFHSDLRRACTTFEELYGEEARELSILCIPREDLREELLSEKVQFSNEKLEERTKLFLSEISQRKENRILLVGHSRFFRTMIRNMNFVIPNATTWRVGLSKDSQLVGQVEYVLGPELIVL